MVDAAGQRLVRLDEDLDAEAALEIAQMRALLVEDVERDGGARAHRHVELRVARSARPRARAARAARRRRSSARRRRPCNAGRATVEPSSTPVRMRWRDISSRPKCEMRPTWMRARSFFSASFIRRSTARLLRDFLHVDEVDDDQAGEVAQAKLTGDLVGRLEIGAERGVFDIVLARRAARVDVDRDQRLGLVDDDVAARLQRHLIGEHRVELRLDAGLGEHRLRCRDRARRRGCCSASAGA